MAGTMSRLIASGLLATVTAQELLDRLDILGGEHPATFLERLKRGLGTTQLSACNLFAHVQAGSDSRNRNAVRCGLGRCRRLLGKRLCNTLFNCDLLIALAVDVRGLDSSSDLGSDVRQFDMVLRRRCFVLDLGSSVLELLDRDVQLRQTVFPGLHLSLAGGDTKLVQEREEVFGGRCDWLSHCRGPFVCVDRWTQHR